MKRDPTELTRSIYDVLIIGGGIYGACVAWEATLRGLSVALVEKADFGAGTSANSLKILHGGFRHLQGADFKRMRESICERTTFLRIAPHLVHPLPVLIPTYGHWMQGRQVFSLALMVNDLIGFDRNRLNDPQKHIPQGRVISEREVLQLLPGIHPEGLTGGAIFHDAQVYNSERLLLSFLRSAEKAGADLANYVEVTGLLKHGDCVTGAQARDVLTGDRFDIQARTVVSTCGPWITRVMGFLNGHWPNRRILFAKAINLLTRPLFQKYAVGIPGKNRYHNPDALISKASSFLFITPWRGQSLIGTAYATYDGDPDEFRVTEQDIQDFLDEINRAYPSAALRPEEVSFVHGGLLPSSGVCRKTGHVQLANRYQIHDHRADGVKGLISVVGVKYTTARHVAEKVVDRLFESRGQTPPRSVSSVTPLHGGHIEDFAAFLDVETRKQPCGLGEKEVRHLIHNYGSTYPEVLRHLDLGRDGRRALTDHLAILEAEVLHGIRDEMAHKLTDVIFRRTELGTAGHPGREILNTCADIMSAELRWSPSRTQQELRETNEVFAIRH